MVTHDTKVALRAERIIFLVDGKIEDEITLGKFFDEKDHSFREQKVSSWLERLNF